MHVKFPSSQRRVGASTCRPFGAVIWTNSQPSAYALGYFLAPLRGCGQPQAAKRRQSMTFVNPQTPLRGYFFEGSLGEVLSRELQMRSCGIQRIPYDEQF